MNSSTISPTALVPHGPRFPYCVGLAVAVVLAVMTCHYYAGENASIRIHDCLDALIPTTSVFAKSDVLFAGGKAVFQPLLGGVPRNCYGSELELTILPYRYLSNFHAYVFNEFLARMVALFGMALLLRSHVLPGGTPWALAGAACAFALLPFYPYGLCIAGQPLLFYAALNLGAGKHKLASLVVVALFPFFSNLILIGFALVPMLAIYLVYRWRVSGRLPGWLAAALMLLTAGYLVCCYRLFLNWFVQSGYVSTRTEFTADAWTLKTALKTAAQDLLQGQYHAASMQFPFILLATLLALATCVAKRSPADRLSWRQGWKGILGEENCSPALVLIVVLLLINAFLSLVRGLAGWQGTARLIEASHVRLLQTFQYDRVYWLHPALWGIVFACALEQISLKVRSGRIFAVGLLTLQLVWLAQGVREERISFHQFYSPELFAEIKDHIGKPQQSYRVVSLGMHPGIALYNGFYLADGYSSDYPLQYKHRFRKVIAAELAKSDELKDYFDGWGGRCYLYSAEIGKQFVLTKDQAMRKVKSLDIDAAALYDLDVRYVLSAVEIGNASSLGLELQRVFERDDSPWQIYLYSLKVPPAERSYNSATK